MIDTDYVEQMQIEEVQAQIKTKTREYQKIKEKL